jgi:hypothetical protein
MVAIVGDAHDLVMTKAGYGICLIAKQFSKLRPMPGILVKLRILREFIKKAEYRRAIRNALTKASLNDIREGRATGRDTSRLNCGDCHSVVRGGGAWTYSPLRLERLCNGQVRPRRRG